MDNNFSLKSMYAFLADSIEDYTECDDFDEVFNELFNSNNWIDGKFDSAEALNGFEAEPDEDVFNGCFGAIGLVQSYEKDQFGEINTDLSDPEAVSSMVAYIRGEEAFSNVLDEAGLDRDDEVNDENVKKFVKAVNGFCD